MNRKKQIILAVLNVFLVLLLAGMLWVYHQEEQQRAGWASETERAARPLTIQKRELEQQLEDLQEAQEQNQIGKVTLQLLFLEPAQTLYRDIAPKMQEQELTGTIVLPLSSAPEQDDAMSREQLQELLAQGYTLCLAYDGSQTTEDWLDAEQQLMEAWEVPPITEVYVAPGSYTAKLGAALADAGFTALIHHGEDGLAIVSDITGENQAEPLWKIGSCGWNSDNCRGYLSTAIAQGGNLVLTVGGTREGEQYESDQFTAMLRTLAGYVEQETMLITDAASARSCQQSVLQQAGQEAAMQEHAAALEVQIEQLEEELEKIYQDYSDKVTGKD